jgi:hypothetical protein
MTVRTILLSAAAAGCFALPSAPAAAKAGDQAWAQCVWATTPAAAVAWLSLPAPKWMTSYSEANVLLGHKLLATCDAAEANPLKPNRMPNWGSVAAVLRKAKPKAPAPASRAAAPIALCQTSIDDQGTRRVFLYEVVRRGPGAESIAFQQYYANEGDLPLKLPQDLRIVPKLGTETERSCRLIGDKGELSDANG